jgi:hypothetical protein
VYFRPLKPGVFCILLFTNLLCTNLYIVEMTHAVINKSWYEKIKLFGHDFLAFFFLFVFKGVLHSNFKFNCCKSCNQRMSDLTVRRLVPCPRLTRIVASTCYSLSVNFGFFVFWRQVLCSVHHVIIIIWNAFIYLSFSVCFRYNLREKNMCKFWIFYQIFSS